MGETDLGAEGELNRFGGGRGRQGPAAGGGRVWRLAEPGSGAGRVRWRRGTPAAA